MDYIYQVWTSGWDYCLGSGEPIVTSFSTLEKAIEFAKKEMQEGIADAIKCADEHKSIYGGVCTSIKPLKRYDHNKYLPEYFGSCKTINGSVCEFSIRKVELY